MGDPRPTWRATLRCFLILLPTALLGGLASCGGTTATGPAEAPFTSVNPAVLSGASALREVSAFVNLGAKVSGTPAMEKAARHVRDRLLALGVEASIDTFQAATPRGAIPFHNVVGRIPGKRPGILLLGSHTDTKDIPDFVGANDGGSSTGLLLEIARVLRQAKWEGPEILLAFFDGEEALHRYTSHDGLHGSRRLAEEMKRQGRLRDVRAMILMDMIGDADLTVTLPADTTPALARLVFAVSEFQGTRAHFGFAPNNMVDDHLPFQNEGVPAVDLIDFKYGSKPGWNDYWHTPRDTLDKLSAASLETVGRLVLEMLNRLAVLPGRP